MKNYVYTFGNGHAEGDGSMKNLLGGKGANLAEMARIGLPVPAGFTITTECCNDYFSSNGRFPDSLEAQVKSAMAETEALMGIRFGDPDNPLLVSCRSGARSSMPGMMETVLNVGLTEQTIPGLIQKTKNPRFVYDAYRRLIMMFADVVMEKAENIEAEEGKDIRCRLERIMEDMKVSKGYQGDTDFSADDLKELTRLFKTRIYEVLGTEFPDDPQQQLWQGIGAVFKSWNGKRAVSFRRIENIPDDWGTAVTVQSMVFGNMGDTSATGVAFTRNPGTGENKFYGEWLPNAQGEDVVAGIRTPNPLNNDTKTEQNRHLPSLEEAMPKVYGELVQVRSILEHQNRDMQDLEFTIQENNLYMLQTRDGRRTGMAALNMAMDMLEEGLIDKRTAVLRVSPAQLDEMLHPLIDPKAEKKIKPVAVGLPAGPGGASGQIVFTSVDAVQWARDGKSVILVREETNPEDVEGMRAATAILTARGGMTSHAALVARGWGKCCVVGAGTLQIDVKEKKLAINGNTYTEGDIFTVNGTRGAVYEGALPMISASENPRLKEYMEIVDRFRKINIRTNAETADDARMAKDFGAEGIGLFRTEHMFYGKGAEEPLFLLRKLILNKSIKERQATIEELFPHIKEDIRQTLEIMDEFPVTIRLLDPPLHEFVPRSKENQVKLAEALCVDRQTIVTRSNKLRESNPMMGHRGVRIGITYPEISEMQIRAIFEAAAELISAGRHPLPEIMVPVTCDVRELDVIKIIVERTYESVIKRFGIEKIDYKYGTMIEIPRAALLSHEMARTAEFFSYGTNDLTQMTFGFSRDDIGGFMEAYIDKNILAKDPFQTIDMKGVGRLIKDSVERGRQVRPDLKIGICGEHGGDPESVQFCCLSGFNYVSCSPYRIPIARLAAAQAAVMAEKEAQSTEIRFV
ncbi:MAG: pyruvate, phosphate dikinase [Deltaproteobacteria bacterium]|nr:pyruvate, phosphate dikinase [Deltaproteobacteria bacterium]